MLSKHDSLTPYSIHVQRHKLAFLELFLPLAIHRSTLVLINYRWGIICQTEPLSASQRIVLPDISLIICSEFRLQLICLCFVEITRSVGTLFNHMNWGPNPRPSAVCPILPKVRRCAEFSEKNPNRLSGED